MLEFGNKPCVLYDFMQFVFKSSKNTKKAGCFWEQLLWRIGFWCDEVLTKRKDGPAVGSSITIAESDVTIDQRQKCALYVQAAEDLVKSHGGTLLLSGTMDESAVHCFSLMNGAYALPTGEAFWGCPQDDPPLSFCGTQDQKQN